MGLTRPKGVITVKTIAPFLLCAMILAAVLAMTSTPSHAASPSTAATCSSGKAVGTLSIIEVCPSKTGGWQVTLSNGTVLQIERRALDNNQAIAPGAITNFQDQGWLPLLGYYGYASFVQHGVTYKGYR
jgi:hypothetical protein